jgi:hypothetical protein
MSIQQSHTHNRVHILHARDSLSLVACSICLHVRIDREWVEACGAIRTLRTFEQENVVSLRGALCDRCEERLRLQRQREPVQLVA